MATAVAEEGSSLTNVVGNETTSECCASSTPSRRAGGLDLASIAPVINAGFRAVLTEASKLGVLDPPHGRTPMPDPKKITEEEAFAWSDNGDPEDREETDTEVSNEQPPAAAGTPEPEEDEEDDDDKLLEYKFDYGFNPLVFLGEYLRKNNPAALRAREEQRNADLEYLRGRAAKSLAREMALAELRELVVDRQSGITHGPIVGEVSDCGGIIWARAFRSGQCTIELSRYEDFRTICRQGVMKVDQSTECSAIVEFDDLDPSTIWYHRAYLHNPRKGFDGPVAGFCVKGKFSTLPERDEDVAGVFRLVAFSLHGLGLRRAAMGHRPAIESACSAVSAANPGCCLALGGPSAPQGLPTSTSMRPVSPGCLSDLQDTAARIPALSRLLQGNGFLTATGHISSKAIGKRQRGKHHHHRGHKTSKRGSNNRAEGTATATAGGAKKPAKPKTSSTRGDGEDLMGEGEKDSLPPPPDWPIRCPEAWGSRSLGPTAEIFVIDARAGFVGEDQLAWVVEAVEESRRTWKVIACGVPVGFPVGPVVELTQEEKETAAQHAAAVTIQSRMRTHLRTKASTTAQDTATATTATTTTASTTTKKSAAGPAAGGSSGQQGGSPPTSSLGKESTHPSTVTSAPGGASATAHGGATARGAGGETSEDETGISRATRQIQSIVSQIHASGCSNVVFVTPARSRPHALSFFSGHEVEGRFPVYELGCSGLVPVLTGSGSSANSGSDSGQNQTNNEGPEPCPELAPQVLMPELASSLPACDNGDGDRDDGGGTGFACTLSFGREEGRGDWLSFVVSGARGEKVASLTLRAAA